MNDFIKERAERNKRLTQLRAEEREARLNKDKEKSVELQHEISILKATIRNHGRAPVETAVKEY